MLRHRYDVGSLRHMEDPARDVPRDADKDEDEGLVALGTEIAALVAEIGFDAPEIRALDEELCQPAEFNT